MFDRVEPAVTSRPIDPNLEYVLLGANGASAVVDGDVELLLEQPEGMESARARGRGLVIVRRGVWHTSRG
jgi:hypothetical protein